MKQKFYRDNSWIPQWRFTKKISDETIRLSLILSTYSRKQSVFFFPALDTHVYTYKYTFIFLLPLLEFAEILLNRWGKDIANCSNQVESNRWSRNRQRKTKASGRKPIEKVATWRNSPWKLLLWQTDGEVCWTKQSSHKKTIVRTHVILYGMKKAIFTDWLGGKRKLENETFVETFLAK